MRVSQLLLLSLAINTSLYAHDVKINGTIQHTIKTSSLLPSNNNPPHPIKLLKVELSKSAIAGLGRRAAEALNKQNVSQTAKGLPSAVALGMNNVPVLDQGNFGSCVTFATTAALDAALDKGDYISQLCSLELGNYLANNGYNPNGWNGADARDILSQIDSYGIISKKQQQANGCGGLTEYPAHENAIPESSMTLEAFHELSEETNSQVYWSPILDVYASFERVDTNKTLAEVKQALYNKERVTLGVILLDFDLGTAGAVGSHHSTYDTWVLTPEIARDIYFNPIFGGHEMVITGYDDNAIAVDDKGYQHKGLFTLRNSWGTSYGDKGDFYMSYDYFKVLVIDAQRINSVPVDEVE